MRVNAGFFWAKILQVINRSALRDCEIDSKAKIGSGCNCIKVKIGRYSYMGNNNSIANTTIGSFCSIASYCAIGGGDHALTGVSTSTAFTKGRNAFNKHFAEFEYNMNNPVVIGNDVWIGEKVFINSGVKIGDGAVVGAHSVVTHDIGPYEIVAGAPARVIRKRFPDEVIDRLEQLKWWNWSEEVITKMGCYFDDPIKLIEQAHLEINR